MGWVGAGWAVLPRAIGAVSIPERVWGGLEHDFVGWVAVEQVFQSLRGFGVGWSYTDAAIELRIFAQVSIPERVWGGLERGFRSLESGAPGCFNP